ncbi:hypothetical protein BT93_J1469 [Corymbia citriodora subsp. variegata]|nr:hypothetical protein BT93_J1469 [Corymbia citriodora subsp. variegata]
MEAAARSPGFFREFVILISDSTIFTTCSLMAQARSCRPVVCGFAIVVIAMVGCMHHDVGEGRIYGIVEETGQIVRVAITYLVHFINVWSGTDHMDDKKALNHKM